jgi:hypothetical protein
MWVSEHGNIGERHDGLTKLLFLCAAFLILASVIILIRTGPAVSYERSLYGGYPDYFWGFMIAALFLGQIIILISASCQPKSKSWILGFAVILSVNSILLSLPIIRAYPIYGRHDVLTHIGWTRNIVASGSVGATDLYPADHILAATTSMIALVDVRVTAFIIPILFSLFYIGSWWVLARRLFLGNRARAMAVIFGSILIYGNNHLAFAPHPQSFFLLPFVLFLCIGCWRSRHLEFGMMLVVAVLAIVFFHPLSIVLLILVMIILDQVRHVHVRTPRGIYMPRRPLLQTKTMVRLEALALVAFFLWQSYAYLLLKNIRLIYDWLGGAVGNSEFQTNVNALMISDFPVLKLLMIVLNEYGQMIVIALISFIGIFIFVRNARRSGERFEFVKLFSSIGFLTFFALSSLSMLLVSIVGFARIFMVAALFASLLIPSFLCERKSIMVTRMNRRGIVKLALTLATLLSLLLFSTFNLFLSPRVGTENQQVTEAELTGMNYFFAIRSIDIPILDSGIKTKRFYDETYGTDSPRDKMISSFSAPPPDHFGYNNHSFLGESYSETRYLLVSDVGRHLYEYLYPENQNLWKFDQKDFGMLAMDPSSDKVFDNGNLGAFSVTPIQ